MIINSRQLKDLWGDNIHKYEAGTVRWYGYERAQNVITNWGGGVKKARKGGHCMAFC